ncbi:helix-turn-helix domain-containing protein [Geodermatophilus arenarius]|uniref:Helix-turn-helix domain-containing protein n=1 Tax=Geodermatophilus arenarius TaxID=1137990 RepID=A0ABV9LJF9_9ACTN
MADLAAEYARDLGPAGVLLSSPVAMQHVADALAGAIRGQRSAGLPVPPEVLELAAVLGRHLAEGCRQRQASLPPNRRSATWSAPAPLVTVSEAAALLGVTPRRVRDYLADGRLPGTKRGRAWLLDRAAVLAAADDRRDTTR